MTQENKIQEQDQTLDSPQVERNDEQVNAKTQRISDSKKLLEKLAEVYPVIFPHPKDGRPVALAIGLHKELSPIVREWGFNAATLRSALAWYTKQLRYQKALLHATHRINLDGSQAEEILEEHKILAKENISRVETWLSENRPDALKRQEKPEKPEKSVKKPQQKSRRPNNKQSAKGTDRKQQSSQPQNMQPPKSLDEKMQSLVDKFNQ